MPTYRTNGAWGSGIGVNLTPAQVDANFYELRSDLDDVIANPPTANSIETITASGFTWTVTLTDGTELAPLPVPVVYTVWRGDWTPLTLYSAADLFRVDGLGIYAVLQDHTSAATFDPDAAAGSPLAPLYTQLIGVATVMGTLDDLSDVTITSVADNDFIAWSTGSSAWTNRTTAQVAALIGPLIDLDNLGDVDAPSPTLGQVLTWTGSPASWQPADVAATLDALTDVSVPAPGDGDVLTYQAGSPTGWIAAAPAAVPSTLDSLTDVIVPTPAGGDLLQFDGADWVNAAGGAVSDLTSATLPLSYTSLIELSVPSGSPAIYASQKATLADLTLTLGSTAIPLGSTTTTVAGLTLSGGTLSGTTTLPGSGSISSSGRLLLNSATAITMGGVTTGALQTVITGGAPAAAFAHFSASANTNFVFFGKSRGSVSAAGAVVSADPMYVWRAYGDDGSTNGAITIRSTEFASYVDGTVSTGVVPGRFVWSTQNPAGVFGERLRLYSGGDFRIGNGSALATTATDGFLLVSTCAGAPTGVPTNAGAGQIPLIFDKTNFQLYAYISGTGWKKSAVWT